MPEADATRLPLCHSVQLQEKGRAHMFDVLQLREPVTAFVMRFEGKLVAYLNRCAHVPTEMDWQSGEFLDAGREFILCSIHGASYEPRSGRCLGGPCGRGRLTPVRVDEVAGQVYWYPSQDIQPAFTD